MSLRVKISIFISALFTILFGIIIGIVIIIYSDFREEEFKARLEEKALTTLKLLNDVKEIDYNLLKTIDRNTIHKLYKEKTIIFNENFELIYSSLDDTRIDWTREDLEFLKKKKRFFRREGDHEIFGLKYSQKGTTSYIIVSANDTFGHRKLTFLIYLLLGAYLIFSILSWFLTFYTVKRLLRPLKDFNTELTRVNENNLESRLHVNEKGSNEIDLMGKEFNRMMSRIENAYHKQKEFTSNASHELRTPLARISLQLENHLKAVDPKEREFLERILNDVDQLNELIQSLLLLSKIDNTSNHLKEESFIDEALYSAIEKVHGHYKDFRINFELDDMRQKEGSMTVACNQQLLEIVFVNLLKNAYLYSDDHSVQIILHLEEPHIRIEFINSGETLTESEQTKLFTPFTRGKNARNVSGLGLGLRIVQRILSTYHFSISYRSDQGKNNFTIIL